MTVEDQLKEAEATTDLFELRTMMVFLDGQVGYMQKAQYLRYKAIAEGMRKRIAELMPAA